MDSVYLAGLTDALRQVLNLRGQCSIEGNTYGLRKLRSIAAYLEKWQQEQADARFACDADGEVA